MEELNLGGQKTKKIVDNRGYLQIRIPIKITVILDNFLAFCRGLHNLSYSHSDCEKLTHIVEQFELISFERQPSFSQ
jgi:hypothetical protein